MPCTEPNDPWSIDGLLEGEQFSLVLFNLNGKIEQCYQTLSSERFISLDHISQFRRSSEGIRTVLDKREYLFPDNLRWISLNIYEGKRC